MIIVGNAQTIEGHTRRGGLRRVAPRTLHRERFATASLGPVHASAGVIVVGEVLADIELGAAGQVADEVTMTARVGGSPANVAVGLARLGVATRFVGRIATDGLGPFLRGHLEASGVDLSLCVSASEPATLALVSLDHLGAADYSFYVDGTADWQWQLGELPDDEARCAIHTGSLAVALAPGAQVLTDWITVQRARGMFISIDPNVRPALVLGIPGYRGRLDALIGAAHLVKVSEEDVQALEPGGDPLDVARSWLARGPEIVIVTHGARGATALLPDRDPVHCARVAVDTVDTVGAGDAFTAGLLAFLAERDLLRSGLGDLLEQAAVVDALSFAAHVAAMTCARAGANPPWRSELVLPSRDGQTGAPGDVMHDAPLIVRAFGEVPPR
jgi:fructokinase